MGSIRETVTRRKWSLDGEWSFALDEAGNGKWMEPEISVPETTIRLPGSWEEQGYGNNSEHDPIGAWKKKREYTGQAWYVREFVFPDLKDDEKLHLILEGAHWTTEVWVDGLYAGDADSLLSAHEHDLTSYVISGKRQRLVIRVDNRMKLDLKESHIHSYHTATNWGGITGGISLCAVPRTGIDIIKIRPCPTTASVEVEVTVPVMSVARVTGLELEIEVEGASGKVPLEHLETTDGVMGTAKLRLKLNEPARLWTADHPELYEASIRLKNHLGETLDELTRIFGLRTFRAGGKQLLLNGNPVFLRGYVDCCLFPQTGYPVWDIEHYRSQFRAAKAYGFNHVRLHGWTAPEPFWSAADEEGMLVQAELPHWSSHFWDRNQPAPSEIYSFLQVEMFRILKRLNAHPSFVLFTPGNELIGADGHPELNELVRLARKWDDTRLYSDNTGFGQLPAQDRECDLYLPSMTGHPPNSIEYTATCNTTEDYSSITDLSDKPVVAHEHGQLTSYVRPDERKLYEGIIQPAFLDSTIETLTKKQMLHRIEEFIDATGRHMLRSTKESLERIRRTEGMAGFQFLDIRDFSGQGHATIGILDVFWNSKNMIEPELFRRFNSDTVLLMKRSSRVGWMGSRLDVRLELSHYGVADLGSGELKWTLKQDDQVILSGSAQTCRIYRGQIMSLVHLNENILHTGRLTLEAVYRCGDVTAVNHWDFWFFPMYDVNKDHAAVWTDAPLRSFLYGASLDFSKDFTRTTIPAGPDKKLAITTRLNRHKLQFLLDGGTLWLMCERGSEPVGIRTKYLPVFWNYMWFPTQTGTTMGMRIHEHPALGDFPHDGTSDWHWYHLADQADALSLESVRQIQPIIEVIDNFNRANKLAYAFEAEVGRGRLFVTSLNLLEGCSKKRPEAMHLFRQFLHYLTGPAYQLENRLSVGEVLGLFTMGPHD